MTAKIVKSVMNLNGYLAVGSIAGEKHGFGFKRKKSRPDTLCLFDFYLLWLYSSGLLMKTPFTGEHYNAEAERLNTMKQICIIGDVIIF